MWEQRHGEALAPFRKIYTSWQLGCRKPTVEAYRRVAADIGVAPADILFLDDNHDNVVGARAAGMHGAACGEHPAGNAGGFAGG